MRNESEEPGQSLAWVKRGEGWFRLIFIGIWIILITLLAIWAIENLYWQPQENIRKEARPGEVYVSAPVVIPAKEGESVIVAALADTLSFSLPMTVSVTLPEPVLYPLQPGNRQVSRVFERPEALPIQIPLENAQTLWVGQTVSMTLHVVGAAPHQEKEIPVKVYVEGQFRAAVRAFINTKVDPLVATGIGGLFTFLGWVYKQMIDRQEKEKQKAKEEKEQEERKREKLRDDAQQLIKNFKQTLPDENSISAQNAFEDLKKLELKDYALGEATMMENLLKIRNGEVARGDMKTVFDACRAWPNERAAALVLGYERLLKNNPFVRYFLPDIRKEVLPPKLQERLEKIRELQADVPKYEFPQKRLFEPVASSSKFLSQFSNKPAKNPFAFLRAEEEEAWLFKKPSCFWSQFPLFETLRDSSIPAVIYGEAGAGKTAMALGVSDHRDSQDVLGGYLPDVREMENVLAPTAQALLAVVAANPVRLGQLSEADLNLFASFLRAGLSDQLVAASVAEIRRGLSAHKRLKATDQDSDPVKDKKRFWQASADGSLQALGKKLEGPHKPLPGDTFPSQEFVHCVRLFKFSTARLVFDFNFRRLNQPVLEQLAEAVPEWYPAGIQTYVFLPTSAQHSIVNAMAQVYSIAWTKKTLEAAFNHRCSTLIGRGITLHALFSAEALNLALEYALQAPGAPRRFSRLCQQIITPLDETTKQITLDMVQQAIDEIH